ncbi:MAG: hypothetical protein QOG17_123, partial [Gammaproteobacteria bacterium]|nr:hypothetical protein [Gammaproteobacteria bacterium]
MAIAKSSATAPAVRLRLNAIGLRPPPSTMVRVPGTNMTGLSPAEQATCSEVPLSAVWSTPASVLKLAKLIAGAAETEHAEVNTALTVKSPVWVAAPVTPLNAIEATAAANNPIFCF